MSSEKEHIVKAIQPALDAHGVFVVDIILRGHQGTKVVEVFVDHDDGVSTDLCATLSREFAPLLDVLPSFRGSYNLVVSSPGLDRPLKFSRQYKKHITKKIALKTTTTHGIEEMQGTLERADAEHLVLRLDNEDLRTVQFSDIVEARIIPRW